jgi:hypothetical protein
MNIVPSIMSSAGISPGAAHFLFLFSENCPLSYIRASAIIWLIN